MRASNSITCTYIRLECLCERATAYGRVSCVGFKWPGFVPTGATFGRRLPVASTPDFIVNLGWERFKVRPTVGDKPSWKRLPMVDRLSLLRPPVV